MMEVLAEKATGVKGAFVYYIEGGDGPEYKLLIPGETHVEYLGWSEGEARRVLQRRAKLETERAIRRQLNRGVDRA